MSLLLKIMLILAILFVIGFVLSKFPPVRAYILELLSVVEVRYSILVYMALGTLFATFWAIYTNRDINVVMGLIDLDKNFLWCVAGVSGAYALGNSGVYQKILTFINSVKNKNSLEELKQTVQTDEEPKEGGL